jgi:DNA-binding PadR family transcriptional regulator
MAVDYRPTGHTRFELAAPRRFLLPAVLLLLAEEPRHGYSLAKELQELRLGRVDRPSVYRALAQLESDSLVESFDGAPRAGQARRSYRITDDGEAVLRQWMGVIKDERDGLDRVLRRYVASESVDARLAEVAGGWHRVTAPVFSPVSPSSRLDGARHTGRERKLLPVDDAHDGDDGDDTKATVSHYEVNPERSVVLIDARSSVGPITFGALGVTGGIDLLMTDGRISARACPRAHLEIAVNQLRSGNGLYDAELLRRIEGRRYPNVRLDLRECQAVGSSGRYRLRGDVTFHGTTKALDGSVELSQSSDRTLVIRGEQMVDIRDFGVASPTVLMLRIYPDVQVKIQIEAELRQDRMAASRDVSRDDSRDDDRDDSRER